MQLSPGNFTCNTNTQKTGISWNNVSESKGDNVAGNEKVCFDLDQLSVTPGTGVQCEGVLERVEGRFGLVLVCFVVFGFDS
jgi:hypothetical protein